MTTVASFLVTAAVFVLVLCLAAGRESPAAVVGRLFPERYRTKLSEDLLRVGAPVGAEEFLGARALAAAGLLCFGLALMKVSVFSGMSFILLSCVVYVSFGKWLSGKEKKRQEDMKKEFPVMVTLLRVYSRAGDLYQALRIVREALRGELRKQLDMLAADLEVYPLPRALDNLARRSRFAPLANLVGVIMMNVSMGVEVDEILKTFSRRTYEQRVNEIKRKIKARPIIMTVIPAVMVFTLLLTFVLPMYANIIEKLRAF